MSDTKEAQLRVEEAHERDEGRVIARIDESLMLELDLTSGDRIEIEGDGIAVAAALEGYSEDPDDIIRIDEAAREVARVSVGDTVTVRPKKTKKRVEEAREIVVAPTAPTPFAGPEYLKELLEGNTVEVGKSFTITSRGETVKFRVVETDPEGQVVASAKTIVIQQEAPLEE